MRDTTTLLLGTWDYRSLEVPSRLALEVTGFTDGKPVTTMSTNGCHAGLDPVSPSTATEIATQERHATHSPPGRIPLWRNSSCVIRIQSENGIHLCHLRHLRMKLTGSQPNTAAKQHPSCRSCNPVKRISSASIGTIGGSHSCFLRMTALPLHLPRSIAPSLSPPCGSHRPGAIPCGSLHAGPTESFSHLQCLPGTQ